MNPLHFLPKDLEDIIINYKEQLEKEEHRQKLQKSLNILKTFDYEDVMMAIDICNYNVKLDKAFSVYHKCKSDIVETVLFLENNKPETYGPLKEDWYIDWGNPLNRIEDNRPKIYYSSYAEIWA